MIEWMLKTLIQQANDGVIQVPEFQRELIVDDDWVRCVLASVSLGYPIGALMLLRAGNPDLQFETHPIAGSPARNVKPEWLLVDGQRRLTSLYLALTKPGYHIDIDPAMDRAEAIGSIPRPGLLPMDRIFLDLPDNQLVSAFRSYLVPIIMLPAETTRWTVCMHGGPSGRALSDEYARRARG
jgi:hypothetical protein